MRPNAHALASRDPALAAIMGAFDQGDFGGDYAAQYGQDVSGGYADFGEFGISAFDPSANIGFGFGWDYGADAAVAPVAAPVVAPPAVGRNHPMHPMNRMHAVHPAAAHPAHVAAAWAQHQKTSMHTEHRESLLDPNRHSTTKIERYDFSIANPAPLVLNTPSALANMTLQPNTSIRPQRIIMNAPSPQFVLLTSILMANVNVLVGTTSDAFAYSAGAQGSMLDLPTLDPANRATVTGSYTGFVPPGFANGFNFIFITTFQGPSTIAGGQRQ